MFYQIKLLPLAALFLLHPLVSDAQSSTATISGKVTDTKGVTLPGITVMLEGTAKGAATDTEGRYEIKGITPGKHQLIVQGIGFKKQMQPVTLSDGQILKLNIRLEEDAQQLNEVVIRAETEAARLERTALAVSAIDTRVIKLKTADLGEVMARTEGVSVQRSGGLGSGERISLNGLTGDQVRFFLDGIPLTYSPYSFGMANIPVNNIERVEIYKGVVPIQFGADALGGAVNLVTPDVPEGLSGAASYQVGSFGTHRITSNFKYLHPQSGWYVDAGGFYDYADNDYKVDVQVADERGRLREVTVPRFHDTYQAYGVNVATGLRNKKWADELSVKGFYADYEKDIQHNQIMAGIPYGEVKSFNTSKGLNLIYRNDFREKWDVDLVAGYNYTERQFIDTSHCAYNWYGECILVKNNPGEIGDASHQFTWDQNYFGRLNAGYQLAKNHRLRLAVAPTYTLRTGDELFTGTFDPLTARGRLFSWVNGLEYTLDAFDGKLQNIAFVKSYFQGLEAEKDVPNLQEALVTKRDVSYYGYGNGLRYNITKRLSTKLTYEYAIRLPRQDEVFGDGQFILKNLELMPERSHNGNLEFRFQNASTAQSSWQIQSNFFIRKVNDLILLIPAVDRTSIYQNVFEANSMGVELSGKWTGFRDRLTVSLNTTYQDFYNSSREGAFETFYGDRIPNTPYYFANGSAAYSFRNTLKERDKLTVFWSGRYVHEFFRSWESAGLIQFKAVIPSQLTHNAGLTYKLPLKKQRLALTGEVQNLTNAKVFDFLGVQRPGRAFHVKLTTQF